MERIFCAIEQSNYHNFRTYSWYLYAEVTFYVGLKDKNVIKKTKIKIEETLVFPMVIYGSESWTMRKKDRKNLMLLKYRYGGELEECRGQKKKNIRNRR